MTSSSTNTNSVQSNGTSSVLPLPAYDTRQESSLGFSALIDPSIGLQEPDVECWTLFMNSEVVSQLTDKEIKRQEHMYEFILTEKHHCLTLALMNHLFVFGMRSNGYGREANLLFPGLCELLQVHIAFFRKLREKQVKFKDLDRPLDTLSDLILEQFTAESLSHMVRLYGLLCASHEKSLDLFKNLKLKDQRFASLVASWDKESKLGRKNVPECLLLVAQRITKYPLLIEPLLKTSSSASERDVLLKILLASKDLNAKVNERVAERQRLVEVCQRIDSKSLTSDGSRRIRRDDLVYIPSRRLRFHGLAIVNFSRFTSGSMTSVVGGSGIPSSIKNTTCHIFILTDCLLLLQEVNGKMFFVTPPGLVKLSNFIVRENAGSNSSLFLVLRTGPSKPEMIELQVLYPQDREEWIEIIGDAKSQFGLESDFTYDFDDDPSKDAKDLADKKMNKVIEDLQEYDRQILSLLKSRAKVIHSLRQQKPHNWKVNNFDGKEEILNAIGAASEEMHRVLKTFEDGSTTTVSRSVSCASDHASSYGATGLPRRADTFGGFDSQQRSSIESLQSHHNETLCQMVIQLADVCGEMFQQMVPNLTPNIHQANQYLGKKFEELRSKELKIQADITAMNESFEKQMAEVARRQAELTAMEEQVKTAAADVCQQREQLYRKLEKLESKGMRPYLDSLDAVPPPVPVTINTSEKIINTNNVSARRSPPQASHSTGPNISNNNNNKPAPKQQLPLHLAAFSSTKLKSNNSTASLTDRTKLLHAGSFQRSTGDTTGLSRSNTTQTGSDRMSLRSSGNLQSSSVQQMLPLRLSEGNLNSKTSTLPRGNGSQSSINLTCSGQLGQPLQNQNINNNNGNGNLRTKGGNPSHFLQHSKSSASILTRSHTGESLANYGSNGPSMDRMSNYYHDVNVSGQTNNGCSGEHTSGSVPVVHRRAGSSPVPMSVIPKQTHQQQKAVAASDDECDPEKILFL